MEFIDSHTHLYATEFDTDRQLVVERAIASGVNRMLLPNIDSQTIGDMFSLCETFPEHCLPMMGLHPTSVNENYKKELGVVEAYLPGNRFVAIGEIGVDLYWDKTFLKQQLDAFSFQIDLARKYTLPIVIHCRESFEEVIKIVREKFNGEMYSGVFHSFPGTAEQAKQVIDLGFKIGVNGVVTFKKSGQREVVASTSLEHIVLETDAPYLTPVPYRGKRNESSYLIHIAQHIADIKNIPLAEVAEITTNTSRALFKLD